MSQQRVFISYQRADEAFARQVREHLAAHGVTTWMDQYDIPVGAYWPDEIDKGLGGSEIVVGILSPDAVDSRNVKNEWDWAIQNGKRLVLLQHRPCVLPHRYVSINFIDATGNEPALEFAALLAALGVRDDAAPSDAHMSSPTAMTRHSARRVARRFPAEPALAGRDEAQARLREALDTTLAGRGQLALVGGEAGIGKTILTNWLGWAAEERGALVLVGGCYDLSTTPPYGPWLEVLRAWPEAEGAPSVPDALRGGDAMARLASQSALFELAADFLATSSEWRPLVLVLEDLHWTDPATLDLLRHLVRPISDRRIMLVATYRDDEITRRHPLYPLLPGLAREANATRLILPRLDDDGLRDLIAARYPLPPDDVERLADYLQRQTEGNPFFSGEVLSALVEAGAIVRAGDGWRLESLERVHVPDLVRQVIEGRLERLGDDAQRLLGVAAVIGHEVPLELWVTIGGADESLLSETLDRASEARIIEEVTGQPGRGAGFRFRHALIRETLYDGLSLLRRRALHRSAGEALMAGPLPDPDIVAHHLRQAGDIRAFDWLVQAGDRARLAYVWIEAIDRYDRAIALIADDLERVLARGWLLYRIAVLLRADNPQRGLAYLELARQAAMITGDRVLTVYVVFLDGLLNCFAGNLERGVANLEVADAAMDTLAADDFARSGPYASTLFLVGPSDDVSQYLRVNPIRGTLVIWLAFAGRYRGALAVGEPFVASMPAEPLTVAALHARSEVCCGLAHAYALLGQPEQANAYFERALDGYGRFGHFWMVYETNVGRVEDVLMPFASDDDEVWARTLRDLAEVTPLLRGISTAHDANSKIINAGLIDSFRAGDWHRASEFFDQNSVATIAHSAQYRAVSLSLLGEIARQQGDRERAWMRIAPFSPTDPRQSVVLGDRRGNVPAFLLAADLCLDEGDLAGARHWLEPYDRWLERSGAVLGRAEGALLHARYHLVAGDRTKAEAHARQSLEHSTAPRQPLALLAAHRFLGELLIATGQHDEAARHLHEALVLADACAAPFERALTLLALAELDAARGDHDATRRTLTDVRAICEPLEARPTLERAADLESRLA